MSALLVESCGPMTSLQDMGRVGSGRHGISRSGAMDRLALAEANALVGNAPGEGAIELMLAGGAFQAVDGPVRIALTGARMKLSVDGAPVAPSTSVLVPAGARVTVGPAAAGIFGYLAVSGGIAIEPQLGSVSLQPRAGIGGIEGRALRPGDRLPVRPGAPEAAGERTLPPVPLDLEAPIRVVLGPQDNLFPAESVAAFLSNTYTVSDEADRMGYRLSGPTISHLRGYNIVSDGLVQGSVQVPGSGMPIVMMADHQTTGGYPKIATVITADLRVLAQRRSGDTVRFQAVDVEAAQALARVRATEIRSAAERAVQVRGGLPGSEELLALNLAGDATDALAGEA
ncbi:biotin-dependent carboxyltransferase family protein [Enterovirga sp.]|jgi:biotin-dependent carboxylase-like uncharacterized protein|uniref:5-oxoprolinase subunit C family protein n=1 Tax=Enterovirga sp. TaxID=2026350 RepID=UPI0026344B4A|nr:biotin-dependent carboxyltransferase family protein [Enterovirga sp.]MDB5592126.1 hypothetical protein [Enterovirga sp.]